MKKIIAYISSLALLILLFQNCAKPSPIEVNGRTSINGSLNKFEAPLRSGVDFNLENLQTVSSELNDPDVIKLEHRVYITSVTDIANAPSIAPHNSSKSVLPSHYEINFRTTLQVFLNSNGEWASDLEDRACDVTGCASSPVILECNYNRVMTNEEESQLQQLTNDIQLGKVGVCDRILMDAGSLGRLDGHYYKTNTAEVVAFQRPKDNCFYNGIFESQYVYQDDTKEQEINRFLLELANQENLRIDPNHCGPPTIDNGVAY